MTNINTIRKGRIWVLLDKKGNLIEDIDTDQIFHNSFLHITDISQMGQYALGNLEDWRDFSRKAQPGDIVIAGRNFGSGSSRQQAVDCFVSLKISLILAPSYGAIYFRNGLNSGFPVIKCQNLEELVQSSKIVTGDKIEVDFLNGKAHNSSKNISFQVESMSSVQFDIFKARNLFSYGKRLKVNSEQ